MDQSTYRDMYLLNELTQGPDVTQRELSRRIGVALGLTNLMLRRLAKKGYIKITGTKRSRIRYLITPKGLLEKTRLTYEFVQHSLHLYSRIRLFLREQLAVLAKTGHRRFLLFGTGELAEIAFLTIHEMGLELVGVVEDSPLAGRFLGHPVHDLGAVSPTAYDRIIVASARWHERGLSWLAALGISTERLIVLPMPEVAHLSAVGPAMVPVTLTSTEEKTLVSAGT